MRKTASILLALLSLAAVLAVSAVVGLQALLDNRKESIRRQVENALGHPVAFESIRLNFPRRLGALSATVTDLRVADAPRFAATPLIHANELTVSVGWLSLLTGGSTVSDVVDVVLHQPEIQVIRNEYGDLNFLTPARPLLAGFRLARRAAAAVRVERGKLHFIDRSSDEPEELRLHHLDATLRWSGEQSLYVDLSGTLEPDQGLPFSVTGTVGASRPLADWTGNAVDLELRAASLPEALAARAWKLLEANLPPYLRPSGPLAVSARVSGSFRRPRVSQASVTGSLLGGPAGNARVTGEADFSQAASWTRGRVRAKLQLGPVDLDQLRRIPWVDRVAPSGLVVHGPLDLSGVVEGSPDDLKVRASVTADANAVRYGQWLDKPPGVPAALTAAVQLRGDRLVIHESGVRLRDGEVTFSGAVDRDSVLRLHVETGDAALREWAALAPAAAGYELDGTVNASLSLVRKLTPRNEPPTVTGSLRFDNVRIAGAPGTRGAVQGLRGRLEFLGNDVEIPDLRLRSGLSDFRLQGLVTDLARPTLHYRVRSNLLNLADVTGDAAHRADSFSDVAGIGTAELHDGALSVQGRLASSSGRFEGVAYRGLEGRVHWTRGSLEVEKLSVEALGGRIRGRGAVTNRNGRRFEFELAPVLEDLDVRSILALVHKGPTEPVHGRLYLAGRFTGSGRDWPSIAQDLEGHGRATLSRGVLGHFNPVRGVLAAMDAVEGIDSIDSAGPAFNSLVRGERVSFDHVEGTFTIDKGRLRSDDLLLTADEYSIVGKGWADHDGSVDLHATLVLSADFSRDLSGRYRNVRYLFDADGISVPFRLAGNVPDVAIRPDVLQITRYMYEKFAEQRGPREERDEGFIHWWEGVRKGFRELLR